MNCTSAALCNVNRNREGIKELGLLSTSRSPGGAVAKKQVKSHHHGCVNGGWIVHYTTKVVTLFGRGQVEAIAAKNTLSEI